MQKKRTEELKVEEKRGEVVRDIAKKKSTLAFSQNKWLQSQSVGERGKDNRSLLRGNQSSKKKSEQEIKYYCR